METGWISTNHLFVWWKIAVSTKISLMANLVWIIWCWYKRQLFGGFQHSFTLTMGEEKEFVKTRNWALLDIEYIQCTRTHKCVRKLYMLAKDGYMDLLLEFFPCQPLHKLNKKYQRTFRFCQREIHKLSYYPLSPSPPC